MAAPLQTATVFLGVAVAHGVAAVTVLLYARLQKTYPGFHHWTAGACTAALGFGSGLLRPVSPVASAVLSCSLLTAALLFYLDGMLRFVQGRPLARAWYLLVPLQALLQFGFSAGVDDIGVRQGILSLPAAGLGIWTGLVLLGADPPPEHRPLYRFVGWFRILSPGIFLAHAALWLLHPPGASVPEAGPIEVLFLLALLAFGLVNVSCCLWLNGQRQEADLRASREGVRAVLDDLLASQSEVQRLSGMLPLCPRCKRIQDEEGHWHSLERYVRARSEATFSHGYCPVCLERLYADLEEPGAEIR